MKINEENVRKRLEGVPDNKRSHIYYAGLILEFLEQNFVPTRKWLPELYKVVPGMPVDNAEFSAEAKQQRMKVSDLYDLYLRWRNVKDYTSEIETRFKFSIIIRHLRLYKNGWEFNVHRVGSGQVWYVGPIAFTKDLPSTRRAPEPATIERGSVDINPLMPPDYGEAVERVHAASMDFLNRNWQEARYWRPTRNWQIAEYELE